MKMLLASAVLLALGACVTVPPTTVTIVTPPTGFAAAPADKEAILKTIDTFLLALGNGDRDLQKSVELPDGSLAFARITKDGAGAVRRMPASQMQGQPGHDPFVEMYWNPEIQVRGPFAQVWAPYELRDNGAVVHCGIDAFQLVKLDGTWKIHASVSTMEPDACEELGATSAPGRRPRDGWRETPNQ
jgi:hypothetical protein